MKLSTRKAAALLAALLALALLAACGGAGKNVPAPDLAAEISAALGKTDALAVNDGTFLGMSGASAAQLGDYQILINRIGANIDEFGVFHASSDGASAREIKAVVEAYLALRLEKWMEEYMPEEKPKLENAEVRVSGDYVLYCILSDADKTTAFRTFEDAVR